MKSESVLIRYIKKKEGFTDVIGSFGDYINSGTIHPVLLYL